MLILREVWVRGSAGNNAFTKYQWWKDNRIIYEDDKLTTESVNRFLATLENETNG